MQHEVDTFEQNHIWELVALPKEKQTVGSKWVYKAKYKINGKVDKYKVMLVAKGYTQQEGLDYHETFCEDGDCENSNQCCSFQELASIPDGCQ